MAAKMPSRARHANRRRFLCALSISARSNGPFSIMWAKGSPCATSPSKERNAGRTASSSRLSVTTMSRIGCASSRHAAPTRRWSGTAAAPRRRWRRRGYRPGGRAQKPDRRWSRRSFRPAPGAKRCRARGRRSRRRRSKRRFAVCCGNDGQDFSYGHYSIVMPCEVGASSKRQRVLLSRTPALLTRGVHRAVFARPVADDDIAHESRMSAVQDLLTSSISNSSK